MWCGRSQVATAGSIDGAETRPGIDSLSLTFARFTPCGRRSDEFDAASDIPEGYGYAAFSVAN
jgi:hypothetical protein